MTSPMPEDGPAKQDDAWSGRPGLRRLVQAMLAAGAACSCAALVVPFLDLHIAGSGAEEYGLFNSIRLLWDSGMQALAVLVVAFSVCFPFAKLAVLAWCTRRGPAGRRRAWLHAVERIGKWSMLDALLVAILLGLTRGQWLVGARPLPGIALFVGGILLSMLAGTLVGRAWRVAPAADVDTRIRPGGAWAWTLLVLSGLALGGAQFLPTLQIDSFWLRSHSFSLLDLAGALREAESWALWLLLAGGCFVLPWLGWLAQLRLLLLARNGGDAARPAAAIRLVAAWSMIDVFAFALGIFLLEGRQFVPTTLGPGAVLLAAALALHVAARLVLGRLLSPRAAAA